MGSTICDCPSSGTTDNPLCGDGAGNNSTTQMRAKAYPGIRELTLLRSVGTQGIVGSICPAQSTNPGSFDFGYRPAVGAIVERLKQALGGQCLPRSLTADGAGQVPCIILEARIISEGNCNDICDAANGRRSIDQNSPAVTAAREDPINRDPVTGAEIPKCYCEITQLEGTAQGEPQYECKNNPSDNPTTANGDAIHGWCYIDATSVPPSGNPDIVAKCPENEKRIIRFVGEGEGVAGSVLFITCTGE